MFSHPVLMRKVVLWLARALSVFSTLLLSLFLFGEPFPLAKVTTVQWLGMLFFPLGVVVGFAVAWWKEGVGGLITTTSLFAFYVVFVFVMNENLKQGLWFFVFASPAFLFLLYSAMNRVEDRIHRIHKMGF